MKKFSKEYDEYFKTDAWQEKRKQRLKIDGYKCALCGKSEKLEVHHLTYKSFGNENVESDLISLCKECHDFAHENKDYCINGILAARLWLQLIEENKVIDFLGSIGLKSPEVIQLNNERLNEGFKHIAIPTGAEGAVIIPFFDYCDEKEMQKICQYLGLSYKKERMMSGKFFDIAREGGGIICENPTLEEAT